MMRKTLPKTDSTPNMILKAIASTALLFLMSLSVFSSPSPATRARLDKNVVPAQGTHSLLLHVNAWGRFSIFAKSSQGTAVQLVDRMMGPVSEDGIPGKQDGRLDVFLDKGTYKILTHSSEKGSGTARIIVKAFLSSTPDKVPVVQEFSTHSDTLRDFQSVSYWVVLHKRRPVYLEAAGRALADFRIWLNGSWLTDDDPDIRTITPKTGHDLTDCRIVTTLDPGRYLVVAYGGPAKPWTGGDSSSPVYFRYGIPELDPVLRTPERISPFGEDLYRIHGPANHFYLYTKKKEPFTLGVASFDANEMPGSPDFSAAISKKSVEPACKVVGYDTLPADFSLVTITGAPGRRYDIQAMKPLNYYEIQGLPPGTYWVSTVHTGYIGDSIGATGIITPDTGDRYITPLAASVVPLDYKHGWSRRFNLLSTASLFFHVKEAGDYTVASSGVKCQVRIEPFMVNTPARYQSPPFQDTPHTFSLEEGYYKMVITPDQKGIVTLSIAQKGNSIMSLVKRALGQGGKPEKPGPVKGWCQFPRLNFPDTRYGNNYVLWMNKQPGVDWDVVFRKYPLTLKRPLPIGLVPGQELSLDFFAGGPSELRIDNPDGGASLSVDLDGHMGPAPGPFGKGKHTLTVKNTGRKSLIFSVIVKPHRAKASQAPPTLPPVLEEEVPFPVVTEQKPYFFNIPRGGQKTALLHIDTPALYRIETTGLLKTACTVRTRTQTHLFSNQAGGIGRNCLVQQYLNPGDYQVTVTALGRSEGHAGLRVRRTELIQGDDLVLGSLVKDRVPPDAAVVHHFKIADPSASYRVKTLGLDKRFRCRIEDSGGWPIMSPTAFANQVLKCPAGLYSMMTLPYPVQTTRLTSFEKLKKKTSVSGRGPHRLEINEPLENTWRMAKEKGAADTYLFRIPAKLDVTLSLGDTLMMAEIQRKENGAYRNVSEVWPRRTWKGTLAPGSYRLAVRCSRKADLVTYPVRLETHELADGVSLNVSVPSTVKVSLASESIAKLSSYGDVDTRARLLELPGRELVASNDDAYHDWNFLISRRLPAGRYLLQIAPAAGGTGRTRVSMQVSEEREEPALSLPADQVVRLKNRIASFPLTIPAASGLLGVRTEGNGSFGLIIEDKKAKGKILAQDVGHNCEINIPVHGGARLQVKLWSSDDQALSAKLKVDFKTIPVTPLAAWTAGAAPRTLTFNGEELSLARVSGPRPGTFHITPYRGLSVSNHFGKPMRAASSLLSLARGDAWFMWRPGTARPLKVTARRVRLSANRRDLFAIRPVDNNPIRLDLSPSAPGYQIIRTTSMSGKPACAFAAPDGKPDFPGSVAIAGHSCFSVSITSHDRQAVIWQADPDLKNPDLFQVALFDFPASRSKRESLKTGFTMGGIAPGSYEELALPAGGKTLKLSLDKGTLAVLWKNGRPAQLFCRSGEPLYESVWTDSERLSLFNISKENASWSISLLSGEAPVPEVLTGAGPFARLCDSFGTIKLNIKAGQGPPDGYVLHTSGVSACEWMGSDGSVKTGDAVPLTAVGGIALLHHPPGLVEAWIERKGGNGFARWGAPPHSAASLAPGHVNLLPKGTGWYKLAVAKPSVLHLSCSGACLLALSRGGRILQTSSGARGSNLVRYLPAGEYRMGVRALGPAGVSFSYRVEDAIPVKGKVGPTTLLGPGQSRTFSFRLERDGYVGVALKADADLLACRVMDSRGGVIGEGIQQYLKLKKGTYLLLVSCPAGRDHAPVHFRPVILGLKPPPETPPRRYLEHFLKSIGAIEERSGR
ncbi:MAG: hypothetical protein P8018_00570 [Acidobacteriota bacterium]